MQSFDIESPNIKERIVARNELAFSFPSYMPIVPGHLLICPIRRVEKIEDLTKEELQAIMDLRTKLCKALKVAVEADSFNFAWNEGENAGQSVPHFHLHVVPRKDGDTGILRYEPRVFLYRPGSRATSSSQELTEVAQLIRQYLD